MKKIKKRVREFNEPFIDRWNDTLEILPDYDDVWFISDGKIYVGMYEPEQKLFCMADSMGVKLEDVRQWKYANLNKQITIYPKEKQIVAAKVNGLPCMITGIFTDHLYDEESGDEVSGLIPDDEYNFDRDRCDGELLPVDWKDIEYWYALPEEPLVILEPIRDNIAVVPTEQGKFNGDEHVVSSPDAVITDDKVCASCEPYEVRSVESCQDESCEACCEEPKTQGDIFETGVTSAIANSDNKTIEESKKFDDNTSDDNSLKVNVKDWYSKKYPTDDIVEDINSDVTFEDIFNCLNDYKDIYSCLGENVDSLVRERVFEELANLIEADYDYIYNRWLALEESNKTKVNRLTEADEDMENIGTKDYLEDLKKLINGEMVAAIQYEQASKGIVGNSNLSYLQDHFSEHTGEEWAHYEALVDALMERGGTSSLDITNGVNDALPSTEELTSYDCDYLKDFFIRAENNAINAYKDFYSRIEKIDPSLADIVVGIISDEESHKLDFTKIDGNNGDTTEPVEPTNEDIDTMDTDSVELIGESRKFRSKTKERKLKENLLSKIDNEYYECYYDLISEFGAKQILEEILSKDYLGFEQVEDIIYDLGLEHGLFTNNTNFQSKYGIKESRKFNKNKFKERNWRKTVPTQLSIKFRKLIDADDPDYEAIRQVIIDILNFVKKSVSEDDWYEEGLLEDLEYSDLDDEDSANFYIDRMYDVLDSYSVWLSPFDSYNESKVISNKRVRESKKVLKEGDHVKYKGRKYTIDSFLENNQVKIYNESEELIVEATEIKDAVHSRMKESRYSSYEDALEKLNNGEWDNERFNDAINSGEIEVPNSGDIIYPEPTFNELNTSDDYSFLPESLAKQMNEYLGLID